MEQFIVGVIIALCIMLIGIYIISLWLKDLKDHLYRHEMELTKLNHEVADVRALESADGQFDEMLSEAHQERMNEIDRRIALMKNELGLQQSNSHVGTEAEILHPGVQNLPHNKIPDDVDLVEYAD